MKKIVVGLVILMTTGLWAQPPEKVYSITKEMREMSWYKDQQVAWEKVIAENSMNGDAWINYYAAARAMKNIAPSELRKKYKDLCAEVVVKCGEAMPNSFEFHYLNYREKGAWNGGDELLKAKNLRPNAQELIEELMIYYELQRDQDKHYEYANRMFDANEMAAGQLNWAYNLLSELDQNAILFTHGDNDTYSVWIVAAVKNFRRDVTIINTSLMRVDDYRNLLFKDMGLPKMDLIIDEKTSREDYHNAGEKIVKHIMKSERPMYFGTACSYQFEDFFGENLYLTGLAYKYCEKSIDNTAIIKRNYEKRYMLDYLVQTFSYHIQNNQVLQLNASYLPSMVKLYKLYDNSEDIQRKEELKELMLLVAKNSGKEAEVKEMIGL